MKGSFWPEVRQRMREKAIELYMIEHYRNPYFTGQTPEIEELREGGYLYRAKVLVFKRDFPRQILKDNLVKSSFDW